MNQAILVTGATGNVGIEVIKHLQDPSVQIVAATRKQSNDLPEKVLQKSFDFTAPATWRDAMDGVSKVFLMRPPHISNIKRDMLPFLRCLKECDVQQVVFMSVQGAENNKMVPHNKVENFCMELDLPYTFLRPSFFMQNLTTTHLSEIRNEHMVYVPTGKGKTNFIDAADIGAVAAKVMTTEGHIRKAYTITGEKSWSYGEVAEALSSVLNSPITFKNPGAIPFLFHHIRRGRKPGMALVMLALYSVVKYGKSDITTDDTEQILGRKPRGLKEFIAENKHLFLSSS